MLMSLTLSLGNLVTKLFPLCTTLLRERSASDVVVTSAAGRSPTHTPVTFSDATTVRLLPSAAIADTRFTVSVLNPETE